MNIENKSLELKIAVYFGGIKQSRLSSFLYLFNY